ncbi:MAG TPA: FliM/FliN family flagellar motor switch protein [bacterium]|nr:FliM/FliN family flagellar motor switch protein [bacterium]
MAPRKHGPNEETQLNEGLDAFEEFEAGESPEETTDSGKRGEREKAGEIFPEGEEDIPGFEEGASAKGRGQPGRAPSYETGAPEPEGDSSADLSDEISGLAPDVPVNLVAVVGKTTTSVGDLIKVRLGQVIDLGRPPGETVDLVANGRLIARGELVEMDGKLGVRILKMVR